MINGINGINLLDDKKIFNISDNNYIQTEPLPNNQLLLLLNQSAGKNAKNSKITKNPAEKEDGVISCLTNSLKIFEKIQKDFEMSAKNNTVDIEENRDRVNNNYGELSNRSNRSANSRYREELNVMNTTNGMNARSSTPSSPLKSQSTRDLAKLGLQLNKIRDFNYYQVINVSETEKNRISKHIEDNSESRIKNYSELFSIINSTLEDIKESIKVLNEERNFGISQVSLLPIAPTSNQISVNEKDILKNKIEKKIIFANIDENVEYKCNDENLNMKIKTNNYEQLKEDLLCHPKSRKVSKSFSKGPSKNQSRSPSFIHEESCDFSESSMLENAIIAPPKLENRCSLLLYQDFIRGNTNENENYTQNKNMIKKESFNFSRLNASQNNFDMTGNFDRTIIEYDSIISATDEFEKNINTQEIIGKSVPMFSEKFNPEK